MSKKDPIDLNQIEHLPSKEDTAPNSKDSSLLSLKKKPIPFKKYNSVKNLDLNQIRILDDLPDSPIKKNLGTLENLLESPIPKGPELRFFDKVHAQPNASIPEKIQENNKISIGKINEDIDHLAMEIDQIYNKMPALLEQRRRLQYKPNNQTNPLSMSQQNHPIKIEPRFEPANMLSTHQRHPVRGSMDQKAFNAMKTFNNAASQLSNQKVHIGSQGLQGNFDDTLCFTEQEKNGQLEKKIPHIQIINHPVYRSTPSSPNELNKNFGQNTIGVSAKTLYKNKFQKKPEPQHTIGISTTPQKDSKKMPMIKSQSTKNLNEKKFDFIRHENQPGSTHFKIKW